MPACRRCGGALDREGTCRSCRTSPTASQLPTEAPSLREGGHAGSTGLPTGTILLGRYRIEGFLGQGGMGTVYRAEDLTLRTEVALKLLPDSLRSDPRALERLRSEVRHARRVTHPSVCRVHDIGEFDGQPFLTMELIRGEDLSSLLRRIGRLPNEKALAIARQLCAGLAAAHAQDVLHRDLKPANVMIDERGAVRITDFGLAIRPDEARAGELAGTPAYMAPEQLRGEPATARSDVFALGLVLHELWSGQRARGGAPEAARGRGLRARGDRRGGRRLPRRPRRGRPRDAPSPGPAEARRPAGRGRLRRDGLHGDEPADGALARLPFLSFSMPALGIVLALLAYGFRTALGQGRTGSITRTPSPA